MRAIVQRGYGAPDDVLRLGEIEQPAIHEDDVLVAVRAAALNPVDWHYVRGLPYVMRLLGPAGFGLRGPRTAVRGIDLAGRVEAVGSNVTRFRPGDEVFAAAAGAFADYACVPERLLVAKPANLTMEQAASVPLAALTALQGLREVGRLQAGQRVLIIGASGGVGSFAVQVARSMGAEVTGVCSTRNLEFIQALGADRLIDYSRDDYARGDLKYDVIFQIGGTASPSDLARAVTPGGTVALCSGDSAGKWIGPLGRTVRAVAISKLTRHRLIPFVTRRSAEDLELIKGLIEAGKIAPVIDRTYALADVPEALRYVESGHTRGKVVITM